MSLENFYYSDETYDMWTLDDSWSAQILFNTWQIVQTQFRQTNCMVIRHK